MCLGSHQGKFIHFLPQEANMLYSLYLKEKWHSRKRAIPYEEYLCKGTFTHTILLCIIPCVIYLFGLPDLFSHFFLPV